MKYFIRFSLVFFWISFSHTSQSFSHNSSSLKVKIIFGRATSIKSDAIVNSGNTRFEFFGGGAKHLSKSIGKIKGQELPDFLRSKYGEMKVGEALITTHTGKLSDQFKYIIHVSAVHTAGNPPKSLIPRSLHNEHPAIMGSFMSVKNSILNSLLVANKYGVKSINIPPLATSRGISKKVSIEALKIAISEYHQKVGTKNQIDIINYVVNLKSKKKDLSKKYVVSEKQVWQDTWNFYFK